MNGVGKTQKEEQRPARMAEQQPGRRNFIAPPANISANENEYLLELEMPGVEKQGLEITVEGNELTILGRRKKELPEGELVYWETPLTADYRRLFELGADVDTSKVRAEMDQGVLKLRLPRRDDAKRRKIQVSG